MLQQYQIDRINLIKSILPYFNDNFVLKGGTALSLYYGLNRYSEDLDFDCKSNNMNFITNLKKHKDFNNWNITIAKDTESVFRAKIDYGATSHLGAYPLKIEISNRNKKLLQTRQLNYSIINGVCVYDIEELARMKVSAFSGRDKIRDFYDIGFLLENYPHCFSKESLLSIKDKIFYAGELELQLLLEDEIETHKLVSINDNIINYPQNMLDKIDDIITNIERQETGFRAKKLR